MKRNKRFRGLYWLVLVVPLVLWWAVGSEAGIVRNATSSQNGQDSISVPFALLDTLGNPVAVDSAQDWGCMITYYPNGTEAVVDSFLLDASTNAQVRYNTARFRGLQTWYYRRQVSDLDGTPVNGTYSYQFILRDSSLHMFTIYRGEFQVYQSNTLAASFDSTANAIATANKVNFGRWSAAQRDSILNTILDANKVNFGRWSAAQRDSILNAIATANKVNFGRWSAAQRDSILNAITDANKANFGSGSFTGLTLEQFDSATATWAGPDSIAIIVWNYATRSLTILDEDNTTIDLDGSLVAANVTQISGDGTAADNLETMLDGTGGQTLTLEGLTITASSGPGVAITGAAGQTGVSIFGGAGGSGLLLSSGITSGYGLSITGSDGALSGLLASSNFESGALRFGQEIDTVGDEGGVNVEGGAGASAADVWAYGTRTLTSAGASDIYPLSGFTFVVDAAGADPDQQFVVDTASLGGLSSHEETLINRMLVVRSLSGIEVQIPTTITRVAYTADNCSLSINFAMPLDFAENDTVQITGLWQHSFATLAEASDSAAQAVLDADTSSHITDGTVGQAIARGGADLTDSSRVKTMLANNEYSKMKDSANVVFAKGNASSLPRLGDLAGPNDSSYVKGGRVDVVDSTGVLGEEIAGSGGSCTGDGAIAFNLYFVDTLGTDEAVGDGHISLYTNANCTGTPAYWGKTGALGYIPFSIDTGTYWACASKIASVNATSAQYFHVTASSSDSVLGYGFATSTRAVIDGIVQLPGGPDTVCAYCDVVFEMVTAGGNVRDTVLNTVVIPQAVTGYTLATGVPVQSSGAPFELRKTQNLVSTVGQTKYAVKWVMKVTLNDGSIWQSNQFSISNSTDVVDIGEI